MQHIVNLSFRSGINGVPSLRHPYGRAGHGDGTGTVASNRWLQSRMTASNAIGVGRWKLCVGVGPGTGKLKIGGIGENGLRTQKRDPNLGLKEPRSHGSTDAPCVQGMRHKGAGVCGRWVAYTCLSTSLNMAKLYLIGC